MLILWNEKDPLAMSLFRLERMGIGHDNPDVRAQSGFSVRSCRLSQFAPGLFSIRLATLTLI